MKRKVVRLGKLDRLYVHKKAEAAARPCVMESAAVLNCWSNVRGGTPDASECKAFVESLTICMRNFV